MDRTIENLSLRLHFVEEDIGEEKIAEVIKKFLGNNNIFKINTKICYTKNTKTPYKTIFIHFKKLFIDNKNEIYYNKFIAGEIINIIYSYPNYWRCSIINNNNNKQIPKPLPKQNN